MPRLPSLGGGGGSENGASYSSLSSIAEDRCLVLRNIGETLRISKALRPAPPPVAQEAVGRARPDCVPADPLR